VVLAAVVVMTNTALANPSKPLVGAGAIWTQDALQLQTINRKDFAPVIQMVDQNVPQDGRLALKTGMESWDYPFFGRDLQRKVTQVEPGLASPDGQWLDAHQMDYLLVDPGVRTFLALPPGLDWVAETQNWTLFKKDLSAPPADPKTQAYFAGTADPSGLVHINPALTGQVGIIYASSGHWKIETADGSPFLWLGEKQTEGLWMNLMVTRPARVRLTFAMQPGPARADVQRSLALTHLQGSRTLSNQKGQFQGSTEVTFEEELPEGINVLILSATDPVMIHMQPNGDARPLLVRVNGVHISLQP
jgi:hypothetical protein